MKKILLPTLLASSLVLANENFIELGFGGANIKDNFDTESKEKISSLGKADSESTGIPYIDFYYGYNLSKDVKLYISKPMEDINAGVELTTQYGFFDIGIKNGLFGEAWENPYLTNSKREKTDVDEFGGYVGYGFSLANNHDAMIRYEYSNVDFDKDLLSEDLKRDAKRHIVSLENTFMTQLFNQNTAVLANVVFENYDADGKASAYDKYEFEFGVSTALATNFDLAVLANVGKKEYDAYNTEVNEKVDVDIYGAKAILTWDKPLGYENTYASFKTGYEKEEANAEFFDKEGTFAIVSVGYRF